MTDDQKLLEEYSKEILGGLYDAGDAFTVKSLIDSHRAIRERVRSCNEEQLAFQKEGYDYGYKIALMHVAESTIQYEDLRKMTIQDLANLIGED